MTNGSPLRLFAINMGNFYQMVSDTMPDFIEILRMVEDKLIDYHVNDVLLKLYKVGERFKVGKIKLVKPHYKNSLEIIFERSKLCEVELGFYSICFPSYVYLNEKKYRTVWFSIKTEVPPTSIYIPNTVQLIVNIGNIVGWNVLHSFAKEVDAEYGTDVAAKVIDEISKFNFKPIKYLSGMGYKDLVYDAGDVEDELRMTIPIRDLAVILHYFNESSGICIDVLRGGAIDVTPYRTLAAVAFEAKIEDLVNAFDYWLSIYTYYYLLYNKLFNILYVS